MFWFPMKEKALEAGSNLWIFLWPY